jgi:hypothetical protein
VILGGNLKVKKYHLFKDLLNKYFSLISKLEEENVPLPDFDIKTNNVINEVFVTINEIVDILKIIDPSKASGPDKISHKM